MESGGFLSRSVEVCRVAVELSGAILSSSLSRFLSSSCRVVEARAQNDSKTNGNGKGTAGAERMTNFDQPQIHKSAS